VWLSITLVFNQLASGQGVLLQGMRKLQYLAKANMAGSVLGLLVSIPVYYFWRIDGIVPAAIITSVLLLVITWYFAAKVKLRKVEVTRQKTILEGKGMLRMGFMLSLSGFMTLGTSYILRVFISNTGGLEDVGLYSAGFSIISTYVGLVFAAMSTDYYPRLSGVAHDNKQATLLINQQAEVAILILAPILTVFLIFINWVVIILFSIKFSPVNEMIRWAALGMYFKASGWSIAFILLAKGASKLFFWNELITNIYVLGLNILGYKIIGLDGLGISFMVGYLIYCLQVFFIARYNYRFSFNNEFYKIFGVQLLLGLLCFFIIKLMPTHWAYLAGIPVICFSTWFSFKEMDKRIELKSILGSYLKKLWN
jgi:O-antigen/teichoic acid export membrane protein